MPIFRYKKLYPRSVESRTVQQDLDEYIRIGVIDSVDPTNGKCIIKWLDKPGMRVNVDLSQGSHDEWNIPKKGSICLVGIDVGDQAHILRYYNVGYASKINSYKLPNLKEGEKLWEVNGSFIYMKQNGDVELITDSMNSMILENGSGTARFTNVNWKITTSGGSNYFGIVKRIKLTGSSLENITDSSGNPLIEYTLDIYEDSTQTGDPIVSLVLGTDVNQDGSPVDKNDGIAVPVSNPNKEVALRISLKSGIKLTIDKEGVLEMSGVSKYNLNNGSVDASDPDMALGLDTNNSSLGTSGQHVAREHDPIAIPISSNTDTAHLELATDAISNLTSLQLVATAFISPTGPCVFVPSVIPPNTNISGSIVSGAKNIYAGDQ